MAKEGEKGDFGPSSLRFSPVLCEQELVALSCFPGASLWIYG